MQVTLTAIDWTETSKRPDALAARAETDHREALLAQADLLNAEDPIDELEVSPLTEGCYFISLSPETVARLDAALAPLSVPVFVDLHAQAGLESPAPQELAEWIQQWRAALKFARAEGLGLIGHCG